MIIIYHKKKSTGEITNAGKPTKSLPQTMDGIAPMIAEWNAQKDHGTVAVAVEVADDGLEAYLLNRMNKRANMDKQAVQDVIAAIEDALTCARYLED